MVKALARVRHRPADRDFSFYRPLDCAVCGFAWTERLCVGQRVARDDGVLSTGCLDHRPLPGLAAFHGALQSFSGLATSNDSDGDAHYIPYRANTPDSPRSYFLEHMPEVHKVFFEFKEFTALFPLPLSVAASFILWRYGRQILERD
jgi:hypothetical protein